MENVFQPHGEYSHPTESIPRPPHGKYSQAVHFDVTMKSKILEFRERHFTKANFDTTVGANRSQSMEKKIMCKENSYGYLRILIFIIIPLVASLVSFFFAFSPSIFSFVFGNSLIVAPPLCLQRYEHTCS